MTDAGRSPDIGPSVCPFVALAADRDRRADGPDEGNRCYAERAPRQRDLLFQADFCYSPRFSSCAVFLAWAARNAAEPAYVSEAARKAWGSGITAPEGGRDEADAGAHEAEPPTPEGGLFGPAEPDPAPRPRPEQLDWISASAWAEVPWDERAELEAAEVEALDEDESDAEADDEADEPPAEEALQAPKVPAAVPVRRRRKPQEPIRSRGSGEWHYADPPGHEPLVRRRSGITPPILLAVLGVLVAALVVFMIPTLFFSGGGTAAASPSASPSHQPASTRQPTATAEPTGAPSPSAEPAIRTYTVRPGDSLSAIAGRPNVGVEMRLLQCINRITNPNRIAVGQVLRIPPEGYVCPPGWRRSTPEPFEE